MAGRPRRKAGTRTKKRINAQSSQSDIDFEILRGEIPRIKDAYVAADGDPDVGDAESGQVILASIPFQEENGDFVSYAIFANEPDQVYGVKSTNLMSDDPAYLDHVKIKASKYDGVKKAIEAHQCIVGDKKKKRKKKKKKHKSKKKKKSEKKKDQRKTEKVCLFLLFCDAKFVYLFFYYF